MTIWIAQNNSRAHESDACENALNDPSDSIGVDRDRPVWRFKGEECRDSGAKADQGVRAQPSWFSMQLAVQTERAPENDCRTQAQGNFFISG